MRISDWSSDVCSSDLISVTGSHNPPDYNGFKVVVGGETLHGDAITDLHSRVAEDRLHEAPSPGGHSERDISGDYVQRIASDVQIARPLKVVVDAGNGVAGDIGPRVLEAIGAEVIPLFCEIDGSLDRKSTRLNSSLMRISYAVFCLNKKNKKTTP